MGQKVNPHGLRVGVIKDWDSRWYARDAQSHLESDEARRVSPLQTRVKAPQLALHQSENRQVFRPAKKNDRSRKF